MKTKRRIIFFIGLTITIVFLLFSQMVGYYLTNFTKQRANVVADEAALQQSLLIRSHIEKAIDMSNYLKMSTKQLLAQSQFDDQLADGILADMLRENKNFQGAWIVWNDSNKVNKNRYWEWNRGKVQLSKIYDRTDDNIYGMIKKATSTIIIPHFLYNKTSLSFDLISVATPIIINGKYCGAVGVDFNINQLQSVIKDINIIRYGYASLLNEEFNYVAHKNKLKVGTSLADEENDDDLKSIKEQLLKGQTVRLERETQIMSGVGYQIFTPLPLAGTNQTWYFVVQIPLDKVLQPAFAIRNYTIIASVVALLIILLLLNVVINWVINPIVQMARLLDQLANGQSVAEEIKLSYNDEIGEMNYNFLKLVKALEEKDIAEKALMRARDSAEDSRHKLQVLNRELEQRVEQRTASLAEEIEDRKAAQEALLESEASYKNLVQNSFQGLVIFDENGILFTNHRLSEIFGRSAQELDGMSIDRFYHLHHPDEAYLVRSKLDQLKQDPNFVRQYLYRILKKNGDVRWVEDYTSSINYQGKPAVQVVLLDVNERKLIEKDLAHYRNFLRRIIDNTPNLIFVKDLEGKFVQANITAAQHFGFSVEALQGKTEDELGVQLFGQHTHEYDQLVAKELKIQKLPITTITTPDGHKQHYELVKIPLLQSNGICNNILTVATDITQRLHAEERAKRAATTIRTMFNSIHDAIILHNTQHEIIDANAKIEELFGLRRDEVLGMHIFAFLSPRMSHARIEKTLRNLGLHASRVFEIRARHPKTKEFFDTEVYISKIEIDEQAYFITSIRNITERKQFQSALERSKSQAQEAIVQKGETLLHISTELRNPIRKSLALLEEEPTTQNNAQLHKYINQINTIITDIRKIAHIEQKAKYPTPMPVVVSDFLQQISNGYQHIAQTQNISWESNTNQKLPTAVLIDEQLLQNLLDRIVQQIIETGTITKIESQVHTQNIQTKPTRIHIHIHIRTHHKPESSIRLSDSKLFLHYCQTITKLLGGNFTSEISPDNTESLHIELNSIVTALDNATQAQLDTLVFEPATILITDDHEQNRHILFELLKDKRFRILTAANGRETLEICQTYSPDLILLDTYMPHMDGFQTQDLIKSNPQTAHIKTVAMTTSVSGSEMLKIEAYRFDAILRKPIHEKELKAILARFFTHT